VDARPVVGTITRSRSGSAASGHSSACVGAAGTCAGVGGHGGQVLRALHNLVAGAKLDDGSVVDHRHKIRMINGGLPVRDGEHRDVFEFFAQVGQDLRLGNGVDCAGGVVEHEHLRFRHERTRQGDALALPAG